VEGWDGGGQGEGVERGVGRGRGKGGEGREVASWGEGERDERDCLHCWECGECIGRAWRRQARELIIVVARVVVVPLRPQDTVARTLVSLRLLRSYGTTLPAEIFHFPSESPSQDQHDELARLNAVARVVQGIDKEESPERTKSFHIKGAALVQSSL
jgi:hypothetical protein